MHNYLQGIGNIFNIPNTFPMHKSVWISDILFVLQVTYIHIPLVKAYKIFGGTQATMCDD